MVIRVTGLLIEQDKILLLDQDTDSSRSRSLPGGKVEQGETLEEALVREMKEETGIDISVKKMVYVCDLIKKDNHVVHITFLVERTGGIMGEIAEGVDSRKIRSVEMVKVENLTTLGFSEKFKQIVNDGFPEAGNYMGSKSNIGL